MFVLLWTIVMLMSFGFFSFLALCTWAVVKIARGDEKGQVIRR